MNFIFIFIFNWALKFTVAWIMYLLAIWLQMPEWAMITMVAVGASEAKVTFK